MRTKGRLVSVALAAQALPDLLPTIHVCESALLQLQSTEAKRTSLRTPTQNATRSVMIASTPILLHQTISSRPFTVHAHTRFPSRLQSSKKVRPSALMSMGKAMLNPSHAVQKRRRASGKEMPMW